MTDQRAGEEAMEMTAEQVAALTEAAALHRADHDSQGRYTGLCACGWEGQDILGHLREFFQIADREPDIFDLIAELRREVGLFDGAMPISPKIAWDEAIARVQALRRSAGF